MKKILITGAHFTTAAAVIDQLKKNPNLDLVYIGRKTTREGDSSTSVESQILPRMGVKFIPIITGRLQRTFTIYTIYSLAKIPIGFIQAFFILFREKPDVILSFGGYVAVPLVIWGWLFSIPIIIHEQTLVSGLANKISAAFADKICLSFKTEKYIDGERIILTGNPIRKEVLNCEDKPLPQDYQHIIKTAKKESLPIIFVTGGNQGSHIINLAVEKALPKLNKICCIIHQTGDSKFKDFERLEKSNRDCYLVKKWIGEEIGGVLNSADLVVSRAGANTLTELAYLAKPTLTVPIPYLYQDEQNKNADYFQKIGLVRILPQSKLSAESLTLNIKQMLANLPKLKLSAQQAKSVASVDAAPRLALETMLLAKI